MPMMAVRWWWPAPASRCLTVFRFSMRGSFGGISESRSAFFPLDYDGTLNSRAAVPHPADAADSSCPFFLARGTGTAADFTQEIDGHWRSAELQLPGERRNGEDASKIRRRPGEAKARGWEWPSWQQQRLHLVNPSLVHQCRPRSPKVMT